MSQRPHLLRADIHMYALASAAGMLLFLYPFLMTVLSFSANRLKSATAVETISVAIDSYFVDDLHDFTRRRLMAQRGSGDASIVILLLATVMVVQPVRVALGRVWGGGVSRPPWTAVIAALVVFPCAALFLSSALLTPTDQDTASIWVGRWGWASPALVMLLLKWLALALSTIAAFLIYQFVPARRLPLKQTVVMAVTAGLALESLKYAAWLVWRPLLQERIHRQFGTFYNAVVILLFGYLAALVIVGVGELGARRSER